MITVGLTGGIASGKSNTLREFRSLGAETIDADLIARQVVEPGKPAYQEIVKDFSEDILEPTGRIDRQKLGRLVFGDESARQRLNQIVHPHILAQEDHLLRRLRSNQVSLVVVDAALMIEVGTYRRYDLLIVVYCPPAIQLARLRRRDKLSEKEALQRIESQMPIARKLFHADYVIDTSGEKSDTREQIVQVFREIRFEACGASNHRPVPK